MAEARLIFYGGAYASPHFTAAGCWRGTDLACASPRDRPGRSQGRNTLRHTPSRAHSELSTPQRVIYTASGSDSDVYVAGEAIALRIITLMNGQNPQLLGPAASPLAWAG
jgi:hypothetical protein